MIFLIFLQAGFYLQKHQDRLVGSPNLTVKEIII
jgi:hypothetical protein